MRIISGERKGKRLFSPPDGTTTRPMPDRVKEAIFNLLRGHCEDGPVLDAFAGTGSVGLEAISRGAPRCVFIEKNRSIAHILKKNIDHLDVTDRAELVQQDVLGPGALQRCPNPCHLMFFDPPYPMMEDAAQRGRIMAQFANVVERLDADGFAIIRSPWPFLVRDEEGVRTQEAIDLHVPGAEGPETHVYGSTAVHWYVRAKEH